MDHTNITISFETINRLIKGANTFPREGFYYCPDSNKQIN